MISSVFEIYIIAESNKNARTALMAIQENALIIRQVLKQRIQMAGYFGCAKLTNDFPLTNNSSYILNPKNKIQKYQDSDSKPGTDAIRIWRASIRSNILLQPMRNYSTLYVSKNFPILIGDQLIISDCITAELFQVKHIFLMSNGKQRIETMLPLRKLFQSNTEINKLEIESYFVASTERIDVNKKPIYALFSKDIDGYKSELVEGVLNMKFFPDLKSVSFSFELASPSDPELHKNEYLYVAIF
jgi:hypothetical protein